MGLFDARAISSTEHRRRVQLGQKSRAITSMDIFGAQTGDAKSLDYIEEGYKLNPYIYRAVKLISGAVSELGMSVYEGREEMALITESPASRLLERPNPLAGKTTFLREMVTKLTIHGEVYVEALGPDDGGPRELYLPDPANIDPIVDKQAEGLIQSYRDDRASASWSPDEMHMIRLVNPDNEFKGQSLIQAAGVAGDASNYGMRYMKSLLKANGVPPHLIAIAGSMGTQERENFEEQFGRRIRSAFSQMRESGLPKPQVMEDAKNATLERLGLSPSDMDLMDSLQQAARDIAVAMGPAPELLGDPENKVYNNVSEARKSLYTETAIPLARQVTGELTTWLGPQFGFSDERFFGFTTDGIPALEVDPQKERELDLREVEAGVITVNEYRERQGMEEVDGGDVLLLPGRATPTATSAISQPPPE